MIQTDLHAGALAAVADDGTDHIGPRATLEETESMLGTWGNTRAMSQKKVVIGFDCNETFDFDGDQVLSQTARGEAILTWLYTMPFASRFSKARFLLEINDLSAYSRQKGLRTLLGLCTTLVHIS